MTEFNPYEAKNALLQAIFGKWDKAVFRRRFDEADYCALCKLYRHTELGKEGCRKWCPLGQGLEHRCHSVYFQTTYAVAKMSSVPPQFFDMFGMAEEMADANMEFYLFLCLIYHDFDRVMGYED